MLVECIGDDRSTLSTLNIFWDIKIITTGDCALIIGDAEEEWRQIERKLLWRRRGADYGRRGRNHSDSAIVQCPMDGILLPGFAPRLANRSAFVARSALAFDRIGLVMLNRLQEPLAQVG